MTACDLYPCETTAADPVWDGDGTEMFAETPVREVPTPTTLDCLLAACLADTRDTVPVMVLADALAEDMPAGDAFREAGWGGVGLLVWSTGRNYAAMVYWPSRRNSSHSRSEVFFDRDRFVADFCAWWARELAGSTVGKTG